MDFLIGNVFIQNLIFRRADNTLYQYMTRIITQLIMFFLTMAMCFCYGLDGTWQLQTKEIPQLSKVNAQIQFIFNRKVVNQQQIVGLLTIKACNILTYNYDFLDDQIFLTFNSKGQSLRSCVSGQINFLRSQLDTIFYYYIMSNVMILLSPNSQPPLKFNRVIQTAPPKINGIWTITDGIFFSKISDSRVIINGTNIGLCQGQSSSSYETLKQNAISIKNIKKNSCNELIINAFPNASLYRVNNVLNPTIVSIYDDNVNLIVQLTFQQKYLGSKSIQFPAALNNLNKTVPTTNSNMVKTVNNTLTNDNLATINNNNSGKDINKNTVTIKNNTNTSVHSNSTIIKSTNEPAIKTQSNNKVVNTQNQVNLSAQAIFLPLQTSNQAFGIWYPYNTSNNSILSKYNINDLAKYQIIINSARILISGGCNTIFSSYSFMGGKFTNFKLVQTQNKCTTNLNSVISNIIFGNNQYYIANTIISIKSSNNTVLMMLNQNAPII